MVRDLLLLIDFLWDCVMLPARLIYDFFVWILEPVLGNAGGVPIHERYEETYIKSYVSIGADVFYLLINAAVLIFGYLYYERITIQNSLKRFWLSNILMPIGTLMPFIGVKAYMLYDVPIVWLFIGGLIIISYLGMKLIKNDGIGAFFLILGISLVSQGTIVILLPWTVVCIVGVVTLYFWLKVAAVGLMAAGGSPGKESSPTSSHTRYNYPRNKWLHDCNGKPYWIGNDDNWVQDEQGCVHRYHKGSDGNIYLNDDRQNWETPDRRLHG